jgi:hypothetical protein
VLVRATLAAAEAVRARAYKSCGVVRLLLQVWEGEKKRDTKEYSSLVSSRTNLASVKQNPSLSLLN